MVELLELLGYGAERLLEDRGFKPESSSAATGKASLSTRQ